MLELFFKNNQAPALNSDNLNRIISEINEVEATGIQNKARTMDLQSEIARLVIEKGGSIVQANPEEEGSENITSILIDDKVYKISIEGIGDLERRIETVETDKADELTMNTGINISDWDRDIDPDVPVIVDKYTNYHDAVSKISQQIDVMGNRTDDLKTSLNDLDNPTNKVIKLPNGTMIQSKNITFSSDVTKTWGSIFESQVQQSLGNWTEAFVETPIITTSVTNGNGWLETVSSTSRTYVGDCRMVRPTSATVSYTVNVIGIGRWK